MVFDNIELKTIANRSNRKVLGKVWKTLFQKGFPRSGDVEHWNADAGGIGHGETEC